MAITALQKRVLEISYKKKLPHIGSCIGTVELINAIYRMRAGDAPFVLSCGHSGLALYVVLEKYYGYNAEELYDLHGTHPNRDLKHGIYCSTGSLGMGICVAVGMALADKSRDVWCLISDGEIASGACYEALRFASNNEKELSNLHIFCHDNSWAAMRRTWSDPLNAYALCKNVKTIYQRPEDWGIPFLSGLSAHYYVITDEDWKWVEGQGVVFKRCF